MKTLCQCSDPGCPECKGHCDHRAKSVLLRIDMEDRTGTPMCAKCADDALESGLFTESEKAKKYWR